MSNSVKRVKAALQEAGENIVVLELDGETRTAEQAAIAASCTLDQIAKSIIFVGQVSGQIKLFITAGGNRVDPAKASLVAGEILGKADAELIRAETGFAIGGVPPLGHLRRCQSFFDPRLLDFSCVWAAAGTPRHIFSIAPERLLTITGATLASFT